MSKILKNINNISFLFKVSKGTIYVGVHVAQDRCSLTHSQFVATFHSLTGSALCTRTQRQRISVHMLLQTILQFPQFPPPCTPNNSATCFYTKFIIPVPNKGCLLFCSNFLKNNR